MDVPPQLPAVMGDADGAVTVYRSKHIRNAVALAFEQMGGVDGLVDWAQTNLDTKSQFYTKIMPKLIVKEVDVQVTRGIEDLISELDGTPQTELSVPAEELLDADFEDMYE